MGRAFGACSAIRIYQTSALKKKYTNCFGCIRAEGGYVICINAIIHFLDPNGQAPQWIPFSQARRVQDGNKHIKESNKE
jgi:hypothetical protein